MRRQRGVLVGVGLSRSVAARRYVAGDLEALREQLPVERADSRGRSAHAAR